MKKSIKAILAVAAALMVLACMSGAVMAADPAASSKDTVVTYTVADGYILNIPTSFDFSTALEPAAQEYSITGVKLATGKVLTVTVTSTGFGDGKFRLADATSVSFIPYTIAFGASGSEAAVTTLDGLTLKSTDENPVVPDTTNGGIKVVKSLKFSTTEANIKAAILAGEHKDTLTFSASVDDTPTTD